MKLFSFQTEIDFLNAAVVNRDAADGITVPCRHCITELIRFREEITGRCGR
jgi:ketopantoate reductase